MKDRAIVSEVERLDLKPWVRGSGTASHSVGAGSGAATPGQRLEVTPLHL